MTTERILPPGKEAALRAAIIETWAPWPISDEGLEADLQLRHADFRVRYMPWMNSVLPLAGKKVLEIGGGTGSSTVAMAECGAHVTSLDINERVHIAARVRAEMHGVADRVELHCGDAVEIEAMFGDRRFDLIIYFASLEHMTYQARIATMRSAWDMLKPGAYFSICDTPNRLWFHDSHTTFENFYHWLPDDVAMDYANRTRREDFNTAFQTEPSYPLLAQWGRGISYHDFEIATGLSVADLPVYGEWDYRREVSPDWAEAVKTQPQGRYHQLMLDIAPHIPAAFFEENLDLMIRKE